VISLDHPEVKKWFEDVGRGKWRCKETGKIIQGAILEFYCSFGNSGLNGLTHLGLPVTDEVKPKLAYRSPKAVALFDVVMQKFERAIVAHDPKHILDFPPGSGGVYLMQRDTDFDKEIF
jgi:hypothetical protein